ncbi:MAG: hypothetical protein GX442_19305 [Candidatus Riflebacteria bacterium]|nr:hypothetical protein [Candidatus Riflebacteria bacterium]
MPVSRKRPSRRSFQWECLDEQLRGALKGLTITEGPSDPEGRRCFQVAGPEGAATVRVDPTWSKSPA